MKTSKDVKFLNLSFSYENFKRRYIRFNSYRLVNSFSTQVLTTCHGPSLVETTQFPLHGDASNILLKIQIWPFYSIEKAKWSNKANQLNCSNRSKLTKVLYFQRDKAHYL